MIAQPTIDLHLRSYGQPDAPDRHDFAQLVLPLAGSLLLEVEGKRGRLDVLRAGVVAPRAWHAQQADGANRSIILDIDPAGLAPTVAGRLFAQPFAPLGAAARKLVEFMGILAQDGAHAGTPAGALVLGWAPLLLDTLVLGVAQPASRLAALMLRIQAEPGLAWTTASMARCAGLSVSRLHAVFRKEQGTSPHAWLLAQRIGRASAWLATTAMPIAQIAVAAGFSEQSALTRAFGEATGMTPAAYRRQHQETRSTSQ